MTFNILFENKIYSIIFVIVLAAIIFVVFDAIAPFIYVQHGTPPITSKGFPLIYLETSSSDFPPYGEINRFMQMFFFADVLIALIVSVAIYLGLKKLMSKKVN